MMPTLPFADRKPSGTVAVRVHPPAERALRSGHLWLFEGAIRETSRPAEDGDIAVIFDRKGRFLAAGLWDTRGPIRVRILVQGRPEPIGRSLWDNRIATAIAQRGPLVHDPETTGIRWIFGESDGLSGVILDGYGDHAVLKLYSAAWVPHLGDLVGAIQEALQPESLTLLTARNLALEPALLHGTLPHPASGALPFLEHGAHFEAHPQVGHKTGFYLDQRDNRRALMREPGDRVLNVFSYTGGFSVAAALGGASHVTSVDVSRAALTQAERHIDLNRTQAPSPRLVHEPIVGDAFQVLQTLALQGRTFDTVVVDPPAFAKERRQVDRALSQYARLTGLALPLLHRGGRLVQSSCSARIDPDLFKETIEGAARRAGRSLEGVSMTGHPLDHPIRLAESAYLKTVWARVF